MSEDRTNERLRRLEEAQGFADHTADQLAQELLRAFEEIRALNRRIAALESRVDSIGDASDADEAAEPEPDR